MNCHQAHFWLNSGRCRTFDQSSYNSHTSARLEPTLEIIFEINKTEIHFTNNETIYIRSFCLFPTGFRHKYFRFNILNNSRRYLLISLQPHNFSNLWCFCRFSSKLLRKKNYMHFTMFVIFYWRVVWVASRKNADKMETVFLCECSVWAQFVWFFCWDLYIVGSFFIEIHFLSIFICIFFDFCTFEWMLDSKLMMNFDDCILSGMKISFIVKFTGIQKYFSSKFIFDIKVTENRHFNNKCKIKNTISSKWN